MIRNVANLVDSVEKRIQAGKSGFICQDLLTHDQMKKHTDEIKKKEKRLAPVFMGNEVHLYYNLKLVHTVAGNGVLHSFTRIPMVDNRDIYTVEPYAGNDHGVTQYIIMNKAKSTYRRINTEEMQKTMHHNNMFISDLRKIEIKSRGVKCHKRGCEIENEHIFIHENRLDLITFRRKNTTEEKATLTCKNKKKPITSKLVDLPMAAFITLPRWCELKNSEFSIAMIVDIGLILEVHEAVEFHLEEFSPKITRSKAEEDIEKLQRQNLDLALKLEDSNRKLGIAISETKKEIMSFKHNVLIVTGTLGTGTIILLIILIAALCCICQTWNKINFYHR